MVRFVAKLDVHDPESPSVPHDDKPTDQKSFDEIPENSPAERYRSEAETCLEMAEQTDGAIQMEFVLTAARWFESAHEAESQNSSVDPGWAKLSRRSNLRASFRRASGKGKTAE